MIGLLRSSGSRRRRGCSSSLRPGIWPMNSMGEAENHAESGITARFRSLDGQARRGNFQLGSRKCRCGRALSQKECQAAPTIQTCSSCWATFWRTRPAGGSAGLPAQSRGAQLDARMKPRARQRDRGDQLNGLAGLRRVLVALRTSPTRSMPDSTFFRWLCVSVGAANLEEHRCRPTDLRSGFANCKARRAQKRASRAIPGRSCRSQNARPRVLSSFRESD